MNGSAYMRSLFKIRSLFDGQKGFEARMDAGRDQNAQVAGEKEDACRTYRQDPEADRRRDASKGFQHGSVAGLALTPVERLASTGKLESQLEKCPSRLTPIGAFPCRGYFGAAAGAAAGSVDVAGLVFLVFDLVLVFFFGAVVSAAGGV